MIFIFLFDNNYQNDVCSCHGENDKFTLVTVQTRKANALLFFLDGKYLDEFDNHQSA
jgi:hypothetical protein